MSHKPGYRKLDIDWLMCGAEDDTYTGIGYKKRIVILTTGFNEQLLCKESVIRPYIQETYKIDDENIHILQTHDACEKYNELLLGNQCCIYAMFHLSC